MKKLIITIVCLAAIAMSCKKGNTVCEETVKTATLVIDFPDSVQANEQFRLDVKYILDNSCGKFDSYDVNQVDNITQITMYAKYEGCNCNLQFVEGEGQFDIMIGQQGLYEYQFWIAENEWDTYSLKVVQ